MEFDHNIDQRSGWPDELQVLLKQFPRESWRQRASPLARFWIEKHNYFRQECSLLQAATNDYREQRVTPKEFGLSVTPLLQSFISHLHGHHQIEDMHYFPAFRAADQRLAHGFEVLTEDHELLHEGIINNIRKLSAFIETYTGAHDSSPEAQRKTGDRFVETSELLYCRLGRHLDDEEDLIIPLMFAQGE
jgi:hemerythrin-like domain-containing protein